MAGEGAGSEGIFRHSTMNRVASSEELDHYIKVTNPSAWVIALAALLLVGGVIVWAVLAVVPVTVETTGIAFEEGSPDETSVVCFVDKATAARVQNAGLKVTIGGVEAKKAQISEVPMSASEVLSYFGSDFYANSIELDDWNYLVAIEPGAELTHTDFTVETDVRAAYLVPVSIVVSETRPINIVLGQKS